MWNKVACWRRQCNYCRAHAARHPVPCAGLVHSSACCCPSGLLCWQTAGMAALPLNGSPPLCPLPLLPRMQRAREPDAAEVRRRRNQQEEEAEGKGKGKGQGGGGGGSGRGTACNGAFLPACRRKRRGRRSAAAGGRGRLCAAAGRRRAGSWPRPGSAPVAAGGKGQAFCGQAASTAAAAGSGRRGRRRQGAAAAAACSRGVRRHQPRGQRC